MILKVYNPLRMAVSKKTSPDALANFLFEVGMLAHTPRSGFYFLGSGDQSVAEHTNRTVYIGFVLASMHGNIDMLKVLKMCLFHDLAESRTSDLNYVHQKYVASDEESAMTDLANSFPYGKAIMEILEEYQKRTSMESIIAKDADNIEWIMSLREEQDTGNTRAAEWIPSAVKRLKTKEAKTLIKGILNTKTDAWWFSDKNDDWWINRSQKKQITSKRY